MSNHPVKYVLSIAGQEYSGVLDSKGIAYIEPDAVSSDGRFSIWPFGETAEPIVWQVMVAQALPIDSISGIQSRLNNMGFDAGPIDGELGKRARLALRRFQWRYKLAITGEPNDQTRSQLVDVHGS